MCEGVVDKRCCSRSQYLNPCNPLFYCSHNNLLFKYTTLAYPADIDRMLASPTTREQATLTPRRETALPVALKPTRRLMKRPMAHHGGTRMEPDYRTCNDQ